MLKRVSIILATLYVTFAFISKELNPLDWHVGIRVLFVTLFFFSWGLREDIINGRADDKCSDETWG